MIPVDFSPESQVFHPQIAESEDVIIASGRKMEIPSANQIIESGEWHPTPDDIQNALNAIVLFLMNPQGDLFKPDDVVKIRKNFADYCVEFIATFYEGTKLIRCNFFLSYFVEDGKKKAFQIHDAGSMVWSIYYNPETGECTYFIVSGGF